MAEEYDVVVIGAGLSGLVAAYTILKDMPSAKVVVLESTDHIGGPIVCRDMKTADGTSVFDLGSARIGTEQKEMLALVKELGLETYSQFGKGNKFWQLADGKMKKYSGNIPPLPYTSLLDLLRYFKKVDSLSSEVNLENAAASPHAAEWDKTSVEEFRKSVLWTEVGRQTVDTLTGSFFTMNLSELKLMQYLYVVASDGGWDNHSDKESSRKLNFKIKGGFDKVCTELVQKISESSVLKNTSVTSVEQDANRAVIKTSSGKEFAAKRVICAVDINHVGAVAFEPPLKVDRAAAFPKVYAMVNCVLTYSTRAINCGRRVISAVSGVVSSAGNGVGTCYINDLPADLSWLFANDYIVYRKNLSNNGQWGPLGFHVGYMGIRGHGDYMGFPNWADVDFQRVTDGLFYLGFKAFWREDGHAGEVLSMCGTLGLLARTDDHPVVGVFDHHNAESRPALMAVLGAPGLQKKTADERKHAVLQYLKDIFGDKVLEPLDYQELIWDTEYKGPAPSKDVKPSEAISTLRTPHGCVHWAGSYTATAWNSSLAGAVQAGQRAASEVIAALK